MTKRNASNPQAGQQFIATAGRLAGATIEVVETIGLKRSAARHIEAHPHAPHVEALRARRTYHLVRVLDAPRAVDNYRMQRLSQKRLSSHYTPAPVTPTRRATETP